LTLINNAVKLVAYQNSEQYALLNAELKEGDYSVEDFTPTSTVVTRHPRSVRTGNTEYMELPAVHVRYRTHMLQHTGLIGGLTHDLLIVIGECIYIKAVVVKFGTSVSKVC
jgi:hypothetical protein